MDHLISFYLIDLQNQVFQHYHLEIMLIYAKNVELNIYFIIIAAFYLEY